MQGKPKKPGMWSKLTVKEKKTTTTQSKELSQGPTNKTTAETNLEHTNSQLLNLYQACA